MTDETAANAAPDTPPGPEPEPAPVTEPAPAPEPAGEPDTSGIGGTDIHMPAPSPATTATADRPAAKENEGQFLLVCVGVTFCVVLLGISIGGVRHFFPGLFANRTDAEIAADYEARKAAERGESPATAETAPQYVPGQPLTANPPAGPSPVAQPLPGVPSATAPDSALTIPVAKALTLLDSENADTRAQGLNALQEAGAAGVTALLARLRTEQAATAEAKARAKELERALQSALAQTSVERERREDAENRSDDKRAVDMYQQASDAVKAKNFGKAKVLAEAVIRLAPDHVGARALRANACLAVGDPRSAFDDYLVAIRLDPRFAPHHRGLGRALLALRKPKDAIAAFERALSIDPGDLQAIELRDVAAELLKLPEGK